MKTSAPAPLTASRPLTAPFSAATCTAFAGDFRKWTCRRLGSLLASLVKGLRAMTASSSFPDVMVRSAKELDDGIEFLRRAHHDVGCDAEAPCHLTLEQLLERGGGRALRIEHQVPRLQQRSGPVEPDLFGQRLQLRHCDLGRPPDIHRAQERDIARQKLTLREIDPSTSMLMPVV